ncbi:MAG: DNA polymerase III subunit delta [Deltaproteobacteria bacterium]|nr:DNA polymerase III subunit delta [Deltaproteobacteria bacterium]
MPVYDQNKITALIKEIKTGITLPVYLLFGDRYLCQQAAERITEALCMDGGTVHTIDGDTENINSTLAKLRSFNLLPGRQIFRVNDTRLFLSRKVAKSLWNRAVKAMDDKKTDRAGGYLRAMMEAGGLDSIDPDNDPGGLSASQWKKCFGFAKPGSKLDWTRELLAESSAETAAITSAPAGDPAELLQSVLEAGIPTSNILMLLTEEVDKRKKLFKFIKKNYTVIDVSVDTGSSFQAKKVQQSVLQEQVNETLKKMGKTMPPKVAGQLFERVGFHPVAVVMETEKLALYVGDAKQITLDDLNSVVGRTRQEALFELTHAIGQKDLETALLIASRLQENGIHGLAVLATLRNYTRTLLLFRALQDQEEYGVQTNMPPKVFQQQCLPGLKKNERWKKELSGHPYAVYMQFKTASAFSLSLLTSWLQLILAAEMRLKGSPIDADTVLQHLLLSMLLNP